MTPLSGNPQFAEATVEINNLAIALGKVNSRIHEIEVLLRTPADFDADSAHVDAALRFAETGKVEGVGNPSDLQGEHVLLRQQRDALIKKLAACQSDRHTVAGELSMDLCKSQEAAHKKLAARSLEVLLQLDAIAQEEIDLIRAMESAGYSVNFREYVRWPYIGTLSMDSSEAPIWSRVCELKQYISQPLS